MRMRAWSWLFPAAGLLLLLLNLAPLAHAAEAHGDECPVCHAAQHAVVDLPSMPTLLAPSLEAGFAAPFPAAALSIAPPGSRTSRGPPLASR